MLHLQESGIYSCNTRSGLIKGKRFVKKERKERGKGNTRLFHTAMPALEKQKIGIRRKHTSFLRRSDIGQFVTCDELILPWQRRGGSSSRVWFVPE
jgi:hypothetical protein